MTPGRHVDGCVVAILLLLVLVAVGAVIVLVLAPALERGIP